MKKNLLHLAACLLLSATALLCLSSCKKEEAVDPVSDVVITARVSVPAALLKVADIAVTVRTATGLFVNTVDSPDWKYSYPMTVLPGNFAEPVHFDVSVKGKQVQKGDPIDAGVKYGLDFETVFESGATLPIASFDESVSGRVIWISSEGQYGSLEPFNYEWRGEIKEKASSPAKYAVQAITF